MLRSLGCRTWRHQQNQHQTRPWLKRRLATSIQKDEPLRILFCGSEAFSITALEALHKYSKSEGSNILSIDVATKRDKPGGRGMKIVRTSPIKQAAKPLRLRVHELDTFTGWSLPDFPAGCPQPYINLIIAVSFGLLVPPRILNAATFGGLNVHPSMLPDLRGAAPINWTIINGHTHTGVTVQSLHPSRFDHGVILSQTPAPGIRIPEPDKITAHELRLALAPIGADMLVDAIRNKLYLQPYKERVSQLSNGSVVASAPKIVPSMRMLNPYLDSLDIVLRKNRAIPQLWAEVPVATDKGTVTKRIRFGTGMRASSAEDLPSEAIKLTQSILEGLPFTVIADSDEIHQSKTPVYLKVKGGAVLVIPELLVAGNRQGPAAAAAAHAKLFAEPSSKGPWKVYQFQRPLLTSSEDT